MSRPYRLRLASRVITPRERPRTGLGGVWTILTALGLVMIAVAAEMMR